MRTSVAEGVGVGRGVRVRGEPVSVRRTARWVAILCGAVGVWGVEAAGGRDEVLALIRFGLLRWAKLCGFYSYEQGGGAALGIRSLAYGRVRLWQARGVD